MNDCLKLFDALETVLCYVYYFNRRDIQNMHFPFFIMKRKGKKILRPEIDTSRPKILVKSPHGDHVKKLISEPEIAVQNLQCYHIFMPKIKKKLPLEKLRARYRFLSANRKQWKNQSDSQISNRTRLSFY